MRFGADTTFLFDADPELDPTFHFDADPDADPTFQFDTDSVPFSLQSEILSIYVSIECVCGPPWLHFEPPQLLIFFYLDLDLDPHPHPALDFDLDPDPTSQNDADPCESYSGSATLAARCGSETRSTQSVKVPELHAIQVNGQKDTRPLFTEHSVTIPLKTS